MWVIYLGSLQDRGNLLSKCRHADSKLPRGLTLENVSLLIHTMESDRRMHHAGYNIVHLVASHPKEPGKDAPTFIRDNHVTVYNNYVYIYEPTCVGHVYACGCFYLAIRALKIGKPIVQMSNHADSKQPEGLALKDISLYHTVESDRRIICYSTSGSLTSKRAYDAVRQICTNIQKRLQCIQVCIMSQ